MQGPPRHVAIEILGRDDFDVLEQQVNELCHLVRIHPGLLYDQVFVVLDFVVDEPGCQDVGFECDDEFPRFRIGDECGDDDIGVVDILLRLKAGGIPTAPRLGVSG